MSVTILPATAADLEDVRRLFLEYWATMGFTPCFQDFQHEVDTLPGAYLPPRGALLVARNAQGEAVGTVALRPTELPDTCEMKRLYVSAAARGTGLGRQLLQAVLAEGRQRHYRHMRLDTFPAKMDRAVSMYLVAGFSEVPAWYSPALEGVLCLSKEL